MVIHLLGKTLLLLNHGQIDRSSDGRPGYISSNKETLKSELVENENPVQFWRLTTLNSYLLLFWLCYCQPAQTLMQQKTSKNTVGREYFYVFFHLYLYIFMFSLMSSLFPQILICNFEHLTVCVSRYTIQMAKCGYFEVASCRFCEIGHFL